MLVVTPLSVGAAAYFVDGPDRGRWQGAGGAALGLDGPVGGVELRRVLAGRHPDTGKQLLRRRVPHRRAGWDLTFAAPKSVSLLAALARGHDAEVLYSAHRAAVDDTIGWLTGRACRGLRGGTLVEVDPVVGRFEHRVSDAGDPHLHSHAVLVNLARGADREWTALASSPLWPSLRPLGGMYRLALRARLSGAGLQFTWRHVGTTAADGLVEIAAVPTSAVGAVSSRREAVTGALAAWDDPELAGRSVRRAVRGSTRAARADVRAALSTSTALASWEDRVAGAGWGPSDAGEVLGGARTRAGAGGLAASSPVVEAEVTEWLRQRSSTFTGLDVVRALAAVSPGGLSPEEVDRWVTRFCAESDPYVGGRRWSTTLARDTDDALLAGARAARHRAVVRPVTLDGAIAAHRMPSAACNEVRRLVTSASAVVVLGGHPGRSTLIDQATILAAARSAWEAAGHTVGLFAPAAAARRWDALAGLRPSPPTAAPGVMVIDRADRLTSGQLQLLVGRASQSGAKLVLVDGGTLPARHHPASAALVELHLTPGSRATTLTAGEIGDPLRHPHGPLGDPHGPLGDGPVGPVRFAAGPVSVGVGPRDAIADLVQRWAERPADRRPALVGFGPAEVEALNRAARDRRVADGDLRGPTVRAAERDYQAGDQVMALRQVRVAAGTRGTVIGVDVAAGQFTVEWGGPDIGRRTTIDHHDSRRIGHSYAVTPARVPNGTPEVLVLGDPLYVGRLVPSIVGAALVGPTSHRSDRSRLSGIAADAAEAAGPPPADALDRAIDRPLSQLDGSLRRMTARLNADLPPDPRGAQRLRDEQLAWHHEHQMRQRRSPERHGLERHGPEQRGRDDEGVGLAARAEAARVGLDRWVSQHHQDLVALHRLEEVVALRTDALARAVAADPARQRRGTPTPGHESVELWRGARSDAPSGLDPAARDRSQGLGLG